MKIIANVDYAKNNLLLISIPGIPGTDGVCLLVVYFEYEYKRYMEYKKFKKAFNSCYMTYFIKINEMIIKHCA